MQVRLSWHPELEHVPEVGKIITWRIHELECCSPKHSTQLYSLSLSHFMAQRTIRQKRRGENQNSSLFRLAQGLKCRTFKPKYTQNKLHKDTHQQNLGSTLRPIHCCWNWPPNDGPTLLFAKCCLEGSNKQPENEWSCMNTHPEHRYHFPHFW